MSSFAVVESESSRLASFDASEAARRVFLSRLAQRRVWRKKRAKEMGVDLGSKFDATVEKARSGKLIKEMI